MELDPVRVRLLQLIEQAGTDLKNASQAIGRNPAYLHQFVFRGTPKVLAEDDRAGLAKLLDCDEAEIRHDERPPRRTRTVPEGEAPKRRPRGGYAAVPEIDVRASAGPGALHEGLEETREMWLFPETVLRHELRARPDDLRMITIDGDSMEPVLASGDRILIDTAQRVPVPPGIFVIWDGLGIVAKRVEHVPNSDPPRVVIRSVNPEYPTYECLGEEVNVVGRVIWTARRL